jgi:hypothetical protein
MVGLPRVSEGSWFRVWVRRPSRRHQYRGFATADLGIFQGGFVVYPKTLAIISKLHLPPLHNFSSTYYTWPAVVIERLTPTRADVILFDLDGKLAGAMPLPSQRKRVRKGAEGRRPPHR